MNPKDDTPLGFEPLAGGSLLDGDYILEEDGVWIESRPFAIRILRNHAGIAIDVYTCGQEDCPPLRKIFVDEGEID